MCSRIDMQTTPLDKNTEQVEKCAVISKCTFMLLHIPAHPQCKG